ncbi:MAG TPA: YdjY domain-containing protein, partial [Phycisphaerae bacterium]|nr:YdjY domain-containing protein [Phycisphaerae bacterium]
DRPMEWVYVGRPEAEALRAADHGGTVICLSNFTEAVIDVPFESTSLHANLLFEANDRIVPPVGTPVELIIRPTGRHVEPVKVETEVVLKKDRPPLLDGQPTDLAALKDAVSAMPARIRTAVLRAEADVPFGRVMAVHNILRDALMRVHMVVLSPDETRKAEAETPEESPEK